MKTVYVTFALLVCGVPASATEPPPVAQPVAALQQCRGITDAVARLVCYDKGIDDLNDATTSGDVVVVERAEVRKARKGLFGFTLPRIGFLTGKSDNAEDHADDAELQTTIMTSRAIGYDKWRFTVEGGAVWETVETNLGFEEPLPGRKITLQKGALGSYFAKIGNGRRVRAKRVG